MVGRYSLSHQWEMVMGMSNKEQYLCNDKDYDTQTGHLVGMKYEIFVYEANVDEYPEYYEDIHKFKHCPNCGAELSK